jgi:hypothetical protein
VIDTVSVLTTRIATSTATAICTDAAEPLVGDLDLRLQLRVRQLNTWPA